MLVIGLDGAAPQWVFGPEAFHLPHLQRLCASGRGGVLRSCDPPITIPAWACMTSGRDPGALGLYGFHNRPDHSYAPLRLPNGADLHAPRLWDWASQAGRRAIVLGMPLTAPARPVNGCLLGDPFAAQDGDYRCYPPGIQAELEKELGEPLQTDVEGYRTLDKPRLLERLRRYLDNRYAFARHLLTTRAWDLFFMVDLTLDRLHHGFWGDVSTLESVYRALDEHVGRLVALAPRANVLIVSDHGARTCHGVLHLNEWLRREGWLVLRDEPRAAIRLEDAAVDWTRTRAWASGGYAARVWLNVAGREPEGVVSRERFESTRNELASSIEAMLGPSGMHLGNTVLRPDDLYTESHGTPPDLLVYPGGLDYRASGLVGTPSLFDRANDTGPDAANHDQDGIFILSGTGIDAEKQMDTLGILDIAPIVLRLMGLETPPPLSPSIFFAGNTGS